MKRSFVIFQAEEHLPFHKFLYPINPELALKKKQKKKNLNHQFQQLQYPGSFAVLYI